MPDNETPAVLTVDQRLDRAERILAALTRGDRRLVFGPNPSPELLAALNGLVADVQERNQ